MTLHTLTIPLAHATESVTGSAQSGLPGTATAVHAPLNTLVDIHRALAEVRNMREFQPPQPNILDELLKYPLMKELGGKLNHLFTQLLKNLSHFLAQLRPSGMNHLPENIREIVSGFIGFILVLMSLYAFYILLGWLLRLREKRAKKATSSRHFEEAPLIDSNHHYRNAQEAASAQRYEDALRQLYMATLCLLDEQKLVPYTVTRSNREYLESLEKAQLVSHASQPQSVAQLKASFWDLARLFEAARYGNQPVSASQFDQSQISYQNIQQLAVPHE